MEAKLSHGESYKLNVIIVLGLLIIGLALIGVYAFVKQSTSVEMMLTTLIGGFIGFLSRGSNRSSEPTKDIKDTQNGN